jgi:uncharacterized membrane protein required for colicin V production
MAIDLFIILLLVGGFLLGFFRGAVRQLTSIGAWLISFLLAAHLSGPLGGLLVEQAPSYSPEYARFLTFGAAFVLLLVAGALIFQVAGTNVALTRHVPLDSMIGGALGTTLLLLVVTSLLIIFDSYFAVIGSAGTAEFRVLRDAHQATGESTIGNLLRQTVVPLLGTLLGPVLPAELRAVMS